MFDLLRKRVFDALYFSPKFLITSQIVILVRFQMIEAFLVRIRSYYCLKLYEIYLFKHQSDERIRIKNVPPPTAAKSIPPGTGFRQNLIMPMLPLGTPWRFKFLMSKKFYHLVRLVKWFLILCPEIL